jgi:hypothetical protein
VPTTEQGPASTDDEESSSVGISDTPGQDVPTTEQGPTSTDNEESSSAGISDTPGQDLSTIERGAHPADSDSNFTSSAQGSTVGGTSNIYVSATTEQDQTTTELTANAVTSTSAVSLASGTEPTKPQACDVKDIALLYAQYVLKARGDSSDGSILYNAHEVPMQFIVSVLKLQGTDSHDVTIDNLRNIALLYIMYDFH